MGRIAALVPEFAVKDLPLGITLMMMMMVVMLSFCVLYNASMTDRLVSVYRTIYCNASMTDRLERAINRGTVNKSRHSAIHYNTKILTPLCFQIY